MAKGNAVTALRIAILIILACPLALARAQDEAAESLISRAGGPNPAGIKLTQVADGFRRPLYVTHAADGTNRLFLVEQVGRIWILRDGLRDTQPFLDMSDLISRSALGERFTEQGLLGLAFDPAFSDTGAFFVNYTDRNGSTAVARYQVDPAEPDIADLASGQIIFQLSQPYANHNGGHIEFGPDGYLYIALGDGGAANDPLGAGQNRQLLLGSLLRIDVAGAPPYAIPHDNPFVDDAAALDEIWAYGLRNVWRFSFDRLTGDLYMADVGQNQWEEINFQPAASAGGENYGWNVWEGKHIFAGGNAPNHVPPIFEFSHSLGCSVTGGNVYRGGAVSELDAVYLFGDWCSGRIWGLWRDRDLNWRAAELMHTEMPVSSFGEDEAGEVYVIDYSGILYRFESAGD